MSKGRILFLYESAAPFVKADIEILKARYDVIPMDCSRGSHLRQIMGALRQADCSYSWFAMGFAARAVIAGKLLKRPSVVVAGGWDVIDMPEIGYGAARSFRGRQRARFVLRHADRVLAFSEWSRGEIRNLSGRIVDLAYLGVDTDRFRPAAYKEDVVVTVGNVTKENFARKGLEAFVRCAALLPDVRFVLAGRHVGDAVEVLREMATPNVEFPGWLPDERILELFAGAKVYVQASYNEGFGLAIAEAMAAGCVPVATRDGSLPEVVGDVGVYASRDDIPAIASAIRTGLDSNLGIRARERIVDHFPISRRRDLLHSIVDGLLEDPHGRAS